jgi:hypothetical protein
MKDDAALALAALALENDPKRITDYQMRIRAFDYFCQATMRLIAEGKQLDREITLAEREEFLDMLGKSDEGLQTAIDLGLIDDQRRGSEE